MIIKELFNQVTFEELCPQLKSYVKTYDVFGNDLVKHLYRFREAYDRLRLLKPSGQLDSYIDKMLQMELRYTRRWRLFAMMIQTK